MRLASTLPFFLLAALLGGCSSSSTTKPDGAGANGGAGRDSGSGGDASSVPDPVFPSGPTSASGTALGSAFTPTDAAALWVDDNSVIPASTYLLVKITGIHGLCEALHTGNGVGGDKAILLRIEVLDPHKSVQNLPQELPTPGAYEINHDLGMQAGLQQGVLGGFRTYDATCDPKKTIGQDFKSGEVVLTKVSIDEVSGTYDLVLDDSTPHLTGSFHTPICRHVKNGETLPACVQ